MSRKKNLSKCHVHERIGVKIGLSDEEIRAIKNKKDLTLENEEDSLFFGYFYFLSISSLLMFSGF